MFRAGDVVTVRHGISQVEKNLLGRFFVFQRYTRPHGYAVVGDMTGNWWVHPESLEPGLLGSGEKTEDI